jgi:hypothetical protein
MHVVRLAKPKWRNSKPANQAIKRGRVQLNNVPWHLFNCRSFYSIEEQK